MIISVNLSFFFHDHRSRAKIFVNKQMKCINDVGNHIAKIFNIHNFYLKCDNQYLPPSENIEVLNNDDLVWVVPLGDIVENHIPIKGTICPTIGTVEAVPQREKKKKKKHHIHDVVSFLPTKKKKNKIVKESNEIDSDIIEIESNKAEKNIQENENISPKKKKKCKTLSEIAQLESDFKEDEENVEVPRKKKQKKEYDNSKKMVDKCEKDETIHNPNPNLSNEDSLSTMSYSTCNEFDVNVNKRRRKRSHRRKRNSKKNKTVPVPLECLPSNVPLCKTETKTQGPTHVRFSDHLENEEKKVVIELANENKDETNNPSKISKSGQPTALTEIDVETALVNKRDTLRVTDSNDKTPEKCLESKLKNIELEEYILKQPVTQKTEPRVGDVIAFKILKLSENYTPEISSTIVGKVSHYSIESKEITFHVVYGWEQCLQPQGKFSLDEEDNKEEPDYKFQCIWPKLLEPRIIFL